MGVLQRFERRLGGLVEGAFARAFKSAVQPVEIAGALQRELDGKATILSRERALVPNAFVVELSDADHERLAPYKRELEGELAEMVHDHAREQSYSFTGPVTVSVEHAEALDTGVFRVRSEVVAGRLDADPAVAPAVAPAAGAAQARTQPTRAQAPGRTASGTGLPRRSRPRFVVQEGAPGAYTVELTGPVVVIGRGADATVRLADPGVSRAHAEVRLAGGHIVLNDLRSTNGTHVNGARVSSVELADGDHVKVGETTLVFHSEG